MGANYDLFENPPQKGGSGKVKYHARIVSNGTKTTREIINETSDRCGLSPGVLAGALEEVANVLADYLAYGYLVELDGLGTFSITLKCPPLEKGQRIHAQSVSFGDVHLRAGKKLKARINRRIVLTRSSDKRPVPLPAEQREQRLRDFLQTHRFINRRQYMSLASCTRSKALADLNGYIEQGLLVREGVGPQVIYFLA